MKKLGLFFLPIFLLTTGNTLFAATRLVVPDNADYEELNRDEKYKFLNVDYNQNLGAPNQYKGKLKFTEPKEDFLWKEGRLYFGLGGRYTLANNVKIKSNKSYDDVAKEVPAGKEIFYNQKSDWKIDDNFNFYGSLGLYWTNGLRIEFEYAQSTLETDNYGYNFKNFSSPGGFGTNIFNQYLQTSGNITKVTSAGITNTYLTDNMIPIVEFSVRTYMINFIFEKSFVKSRVRPYAGFGAGLVSGSMTNIKNDGRSNVFGGQVMAGLSYAVVNDVAVIYLGYRFVASMEMEQNFTRIVSADDFDGKTYKNPVFVDTTEKFKYMSNNVDLGIRFFF